MTKPVKMRPRWHKEPCWECGMEGYATRTEERPASEPYYCESCETGFRYEDEIDKLKEEASKLKEEVKHLRDRLEHIKGECDAD